FRIAENRRASGQRIAGGGDEAGAEFKMLCRLDRAGGVDHADGQLGFIGRKGAEVGLGADDGEGLAINRVTILDVVICGHRHPCAAGPMADSSWSARSSVIGVSPAVPSMTRP